MDAPRIDRISESCYKFRVMGLTEEEGEGQARLCRGYIVTIRGSPHNNLNNVSIKESGGSIMDLGKKYGGTRGV